MSLIQREKIFDLWFASTTKEQIKNHIHSLTAHTDASSVIFANAHVLVESHWDKNFLNQLQSSTLIVPDGVPITWVLKNIQKNHVDSPSSLQIPLSPIERYSGPDLMEDIFRDYPEKSHFFLGSTPETLEKIKNKFKGRAAGFYSPPFAPKFSDEEKQKQLQLVLDSKADFIWVGLGAPKQEKHVVEMTKLPGSKGVWLAVGAAFDFYAGQKPRAPELLQNIGLEWAFRMATDPKRLAKRYFKTNPVFIQLAMKEILRHSRK